MVSRPMAKAMKTPQLHFPVPHETKDNSSAPLESVVYIYHLNTRTRARESERSLESERLIHCFRQ